MSYPILYAPNEQTFENNGIGVLSDAISCKITEERNGAFEVEMEYPISGIHFAEIKDLCILLAKPNPFDQSQPFRIYRITKPLNGICTIYGQHISYDLSGIPVAPFSSTGIIDAFDKLKKNSVVDNPFTFETDKSTAANMSIDVPMSARSVLGGSEGTILDAYRGEYKFDRFKVTLYNDRGRDNNVHIRYGRNLTDLKQEENCASVYSAVYPYWTKTIDDVPVMVTLPEKTVACEGTYPVTRVLTLDLSQNFEEKPTVEQLRSAATSYIKSNNVGVPAVSLDVSFVDLSKYDEYNGQKTLENIMLCDTVSVDFQELGVSAKAKVVKTVYDVLLDEYESVAIGEARSNIADTVASQGSEIDSTRTEVRSDIQKAQDNATKWITSGRGHMVAVRDENGRWVEQMSLDTDDIATAKSVWRWNNGGFGHSSTGVNGPYEVAMTKDGAINASMITTGELNANIIKTGKIISRNNEYVYFDLDTGELVSTKLIDPKDPQFGFHIGDVSGYTTDFTGFYIEEKDTPIFSLMVGKEITASLEVVDAITIGAGMNAYLAKPTADWQIYSGDDKSEIKNHGHYLRITESNGVELKTKSGTGITGGNNAVRLSVTGTNQLSVTLSGFSISSHYNNNYINCVDSSYLTINYGQTAVTLTSENIGLAVDGINRGTIDTNGYHGWIEGKSVYPGTITVGGKNYNVMMWN